MRWKVGREIERKGWGRVTALPPTEQARLTKQHLERKWGVEFPNTGFCNFVKFSIIRHVELDWTELPKRWQEQAALVIAWFEMAGFNRHGNTTSAGNNTHRKNTLGPVVAELQSDLDALAAGGEGVFIKSSVFIKGHGLALTSLRALISTSKVEPDDWVASGIGDLLHFQTAAKRLETRYQVPASAGIEPER